MPGGHGVCWGGVGYAFTFASSGNTLSRAISAAMQCASIASRKLAFAVLVITKGATMETSSAPLPLVVVAFVGIGAGPLAIAAFSAASTALAGTRAAVSDSNAAYTAGIGATVAAGGSDVVPVFCNGSAWLIG